MRHWPQREIDSHVGREVGSDGLAAGEGESDGYDKDWAGCAFIHVLSKSKIAGLA